MTVSNKESPRTRLRILVVEDEYLIASELSYMLESMGHEVVGPVPTIEEAMALVGSEALDGVLLDANLAGTSSAPVAAELNARSVSFVVVTGYGDLKLATADLDDAPRIVKPFSEHALTAAVAEAFVR